MRTETEKVSTQKGNYGRGKKVSEQLLVEVVDPEGVLNANHKFCLKRKAMGMEDKEIAAERKRSLEWAKKNLKETREVLGAQNAPSLIAIAVARGFLKISMTSVFVAALGIVSIAGSSDNQARVAQQRTRTREYNLELAS